MDGMLKGEKVPKSRIYKHSPQARAHGLEEAETGVKEGLMAAGLKEDELAGIKGADVGRSCWPGWCGGRRRRTRNGSRGG